MAIKRPADKPSRTLQGRYLAVYSPCHWHRFKAAHPRTLVAPTSNMNKQPAYTVIGTYLSTFTRTITLGLQHKGIQYTHVPTYPHIAFSAHPLGYVPGLVIHAQHEGEEDINLCESQAIVRYIDRVAPEPSLHLIPGKGAVLDEKMWEFVSLAGSFGLPIIQGNIVMARVKALIGGLKEEQILEKLNAGPIAEMQRFLEATEKLMAPEGYIFGDKVTWADYFLYPLMANLKTTPEWGLVSERQKRWTDMMELQPEAQATTEGTLAAGAQIDMVQWGQMDANLTPIFYVRVYNMP
ncbi:hypothetical protein D9619_009973 [Psilocybe cf. subviscida]|uniref:GST N-terminal domain-containing protein n=1 Tax=Psilocybe cf. subviscida TaxID=2480587 RepID=A0A8H5F6W8_9AGAR|nr:hypothetical protein D9619_009973 [Psilocybe cf. subviscida]